MNHSAPAGDVSGWNDKSPNQTKRLIASSVALIALSTSFVFLRLVSRKLSKAGFWWDDALIVLALILSYGLPISNITRIKYAHGRPVFSLTAEDLISWLKNVYAFQLFYITSVSVVKFSILLFYQRIFPIPQFKKPLLITHLVVMAFMVSFFFVTTFQCTPIRLFWLGPRVDDSQPQIKGKCINIDKMLLSTGSINVVLNFLILALPIPVLWRLQTSKLQMTLLTGIFSFATFVCLVSVIRLTVLSRISEKDKTWVYTNASIWTATEVSMGVVSACIPSLRPLVTFVLRRSRGSPQLSSGTQFSAAMTSSTTTVHPSSYNHNHNYPTSSRVHLKQENGGRDFVRLNSEAGDVSSSVAAWGNEVIVHVAGGKEGPRVKEKDGEDIEMVASGGIRVKTEITLTREKRIDYLDRLY